MSVRRRRQHSAPGRGVRHAPDNMELLAFKYMEMCHVESSTDSDSEVSPRWSDTSTMGCVSSAPESGSLGRAPPLVHRPLGRYGSSSLFLDPYDGSSEDSESAADVWSRRGKQQARGGGGGGGGGGGCRFPRRNRRSLPQPPPSAAARRGSECELWLYEMDALPAYAADPADPADPAAPRAHNMETESQLCDRGLHATPSPTPDAPGPPASSVGWSSSHMADSSSPSPGSLQCLYKRKLGLPEAAVKAWEGKRRRLVDVEDEDEGGGRV